MANPDPKTQRARDLAAQTRRDDPEALSAERGPLRWLDAYRPMLGKTFVDGFRRPVLVIGEGRAARTWTRQQLVTELASGNFAAARILTEKLKGIGVTSVREFLNLGAIALADVKGVGEATIFVALRAVRALGEDEHKWFGKDTVTFNTLKDRAGRRAGQESQPEKGGKHGQTLDE